MSNRRCAQVLFFGVVLSVLTAPLTAQTATVRGTVTDPTGALVPGATVTVKSMEKGWTRTATTNEVGDYVVTQLPPETYIITVQAQGFKVEERRGIVLQVEQEARVNFSLAVGSATETVQVASEAPLLESENASTGAVIDEQKIREMPLNGREFWQLARIAPLVFDPPQGSTLGFRGGFNVAGNPEVNNYFLLDGIDNNDETTGQPTHRPSVDGIQEFKVLTGIYGAEYGRQSGGQIVITTKSGSNSFHGTGFYFHRNDNLDARNFFLVGPKPELKRHQYGGSAGGPLVRDRTFWFVAYEGLRLAEGVARLRTVPTARMRAGDLSELTRVALDPQNNRRPFDNNRIPDNRIHRTSRGFLEYWPQPNLSGVANNYAFNGSRTQDQNQFTVRVDHRFSDKDSVYFSYDFMQRENTEPSNSLCGDRGLPLFGCKEPERTQHGAIVHNHIFAPGLLNELRFGFNRIRTNRFNDDAALGNLVQKLGLPQGGAQGLAGPEHFNTGLPALVISGYQTIGGPTNLPQGRRVTNFHLVDGVTYIRGKHTVKAGGDIKRYLFNSFFTSFGRGEFNFNGEFSDEPFADFLLGTLRTTSRQPGEPFNNIYNHSFGLYVQDDWVVSRSLTLNLGVRYELNLPILERVDKNASFDVGTGNIITSDGRALTVDTQGNLVTAGRSPMGRRLYHTDKNNLAPRVGFAWRVLGDNRTVVRGGYGFFFNRIVSANGLSAMYRGLPFRRRETFTNSRANTVATWEIPFPAGVSGGGLNPEGMNGNFPDAYIQQWSFGLQRELTRNVVVEATYLGSKGTHLPLLFNINIPEPGPGVIQTRRPWRQWGNVNYRDAIGTSNLHALYVRLEHRFAHGLSFLNSYTWSKSLDNDSPPSTGGAGESGIMNFRNIRGERGLSEFDIRHRFSSSLVYELPFGTGKPWLSGASPVVNHILGGWELTGIMRIHSGQPYTITTTRDMANNGTTTHRPNLVGNPKLDKPTPERWFNTAAFSDRLPPGEFAFGNVGNNTMIADGVVNFDLGLFKNFRVREGFTIQFRTEFFNAFNHANFGTPVRNANSGTFGRVQETTTLNRQIQFGLKLVF